LPPQKVKAMYYHGIKIYNHGINMGEYISQKLKEKDLKPAWLARQIDYDPDNLRKMLKNNREIYSDLLFRISVALDEDLFALYSQRLKEIKDR
jgi:plasmid maintenance system antidote protein VapI